MNNINKLVTIIIPVYNTEEYLTNCFDSVINQTYFNLEIIVINDWSTDGSKKIIDQYLNRPNWKVIDKNNGGLSSARNSGLDIANGDYIVFLDSDDCLDTTFVEEMINVMIENNLDLLSCERNINGEHDTLKGTVEVLNKEEAISRYLKGSCTMPESCCTKMYRSELFSGIKCPLGKIHEDSFVTYRLIAQCDRLGFYNYNGYIINERQGSITRTTFGNKHYDKIEAYYEMFEYFKNTDYAQLAFNKLLGAILYYIIKTNDSGLSNNTKANALLNELINNCKYRINLRFLPFIFLNKLGILKKIKI